MRIAAFICVCVLLAGCATATPEERAADFDQAVALYDAGQYAEAYKAFDKLSIADTAAARNAGLMLRKGQGVEADPAAAKRMFQFAAEAGLATAAADLGEMLLLGEGAPPDPKAALPWLQIAAMAHHAIAEYHLGRMYEEGLGVKKDIGQAKLLYARSADNGMVEAADRLKALGGEAPALRGGTVDGNGAPPPEPPVESEPADLSTPEAVPVEPPSEMLADPSVEIPAQGGP